MPNPESTPVAAQAACECCGARRWRRVSGDWPVRKCRGCGHVAALDPYQGEGLPGLYDREFAAGNVHPTFTFEGTRSHLRDEQLWLRRLRRLGRFRQSGRLLDVGCSVGTLLDFARRHGWDPQGIETSGWASDVARRQFHLPVHQGLLQDGVFGDGSFDVVVSSHTLEHVPAPGALLAQFLRVLRPGGAALIVVPTQFASLTYRLSGRPIGEPPPRHVQFYTRATMCRLLRNSGFRVSHCEVNLQLAYLAQMLSGSRRVRQAMERRSNEMNSGVARANGRSAAFMRGAKAAVNWAAKYADCGDELTVVAVKPDAN